MQRPQWLVFQVHQQHVDPLDYIASTLPSHSPVPRNSWSLDALRYDREAIRGFSAQGRPTKRTDLAGARRSRCQPARKWDLRVEGPVQQPFFSRSSIPTWRSRSMIPISLSQCRLGKSVPTRVIWIRSGVPIPSDMMMSLLKSRLARHANIFSSRASFNASFASNAPPPRLTIVTGPMFRCT